MNEEYLDKLEVNIKRTKNYPALIVRKLSKIRYQILDGWHRTIVVRDRLKWPKIKCEVWEVDDKQALILLATLNRLRGSDGTEKRARLLQAIFDFEPDPDVELLLPESGENIDALLKSLEPGNMNSIELEQKLLEEKLRNSDIDPEQAKRMSKLHQAPADKSVLKFAFDDIVAYNKAIAYFGKKPNVNKLMDLIK